MKIKNVLDAQASITTLSLCDLSTKAKYAMDKSLAELIPAMNNINKKRQDVILGIDGVTMSEDKQSFNIEGHEEEVKEAIQKLLEEDIELDIHSMKLDHLDKIKISVSALSKIIGRDIISDLTLIGMVNKE